MHRIGHSSDYQAVIAPDEVKEPGIEYYIQAKDQAGNASLKGFAFSPMKVLVVRPYSTGIDKQTADAATASPVKQSKEKKDKKSSNKWWWIAGGVVLVGLAAAGGGGGSSSKSPPATLSVTAPVP